MPSVSVDLLNNGLPIDTNNPLPVADPHATDGTQRSKVTDGTTNAAVEPFGDLHVTTGFQVMLYEAWDTAPLDTTVKWTQTGNAPTIASGNMVMPANASTYNAIRHKNNILPTPGYAVTRNGISIETSTVTGCGRFWGVGTPATIPAPASLVQDGIGYELDQASGALLAVTYAAGARTTVATLTAPTDGAFHAYALYFRVTRAYWTIDGTIVASQAFPNVQVVTLPGLIVRQNAASFGGTPVFTNIAHFLADTSRQSTQISDAIVGARTARVSAGGGLQVVPTIGTYGGQAGTGTATVNVPSGAIVRSFTVQSGSSAATVNIPGVTGAVTIPGSNQASSAFADNPDPGTMVGPCTFTITNSAAYAVVWVA